MEWTTEKPSKPGWYWWRNQDCQACVLEIIRAGGINRKRLYVIGADHQGEVESCNGEWAGPIPEPTERTEGV